MMELLVAAMEATQQMLVLEKEVNLAAAVVVVVTLPMVLALVDMDFQQAAAAEQVVVLEKVVTLQTFLAEIKITQIFTQVEVLDG